MVFGYLGMLQYPLMGTISQTSSDLLRWKEGHFSWSRTTRGHRVDELEGKPGVGGSKDFPSSLIMNRMLE